MKHLKNFKLFEAVIIPPKSENNLTIRSFGIRKKGFHVLGD